MNRNEWVLQTFKELENNDFPKFECGAEFYKGGMHVSFTEKYSRYRGFYTLNLDGTKDENEAEYEAKLIVTASGNKKYSLEQGYMARKATYIAHIGDIIAVLKKEMKGEEVFKTYKIIDFRHVDYVVFPVGAKIYAITEEVDNTSYQFLRKIMFDNICRDYPKFYKKNKGRNKKCSN